MTTSILKKALTETILFYSHGEQKGISLVRKNRHLVELLPLLQPILLLKDDLRIQIKY